MSINVFYADEGLGLIMNGEDLVTGQEILEGISKCSLSEEKTRHYIYAISDYTGATEVQMSTAEVRLAATNSEKVVSINQHLIIAIVAPRDIMFGISRMYQAYASGTGLDISVFRGLEEAKSSIIDKLTKSHSKPITLTFEPCEEMEISLSS